MKIIPIEELVENFSLFSDWEERYRYLIDLGRSLPHMDDSLKTEETLVRGCTSKVWLIPHVQDNILTFEADSDAHIVRGLVYMLYSAYYGKNVREIAALDIAKIFKTIGLEENLSPNRRSGFYAMVERIQSITA